jgi:hypothetical protein
MKKYGINNPYYTKTFNTTQELIDAVLNDGADPNYEITIYGSPTVELLIDIIVP